MNTTIMEILHPILIAVLIVLAGLIGTYGAKLLKQGIAWIKVKIGSKTYEDAEKVAYGIYIYLEDKYNVSGMGYAKRQEMEAMLLEKFPNLTQTELDAINKQVWLSFNEEWYEKDKVKIPETSTRIDG